MKWKQKILKNLAIALLFLGAAFAVSGFSAGTPRSMLRQYARTLLLEEVEYLYDYRRENGFTVAIGRSGNQFVRVSSSLFLRSKWLEGADVRQIESGIACYRREIIYENREVIALGDFRGAKAVTLQLLSGGEWFSAEGVRINAYTWQFDLGEDFQKSERSQWSEMVDAGMLDTYWLQSSDWMEEHFSDWNIELRDGSGTVIETVTHQGTERGERT